MGFEIHMNGDIEVTDEPNQPNEDEDQTIEEQNQPIEKLTAGNITTPNVDAGKQSPTVFLTGSAKKGKIGPPIGVVDIDVSERAYLCRIVLPGIRQDDSDLAYNIKRDGTVTISGVLKPPEWTKDSSTEYRMIVQELNQPGKFSISFCLPGPVDSRLVSDPNFMPDGILEIVVSKPLESPPAV